MTDNGNHAEEKQLLAEDGAGDQQKQREVEEPLLYGCWSSYEIG